MTICITFCSVWNRCTYIKRTTVWKTCTDTKSVRHRGVIPGLVRHGQNPFWPTPHWHLSTSNLQDPVSTSIHQCPPVSTSNLQDPRLRQIWVILITIARREDWVSLHPLICDRQLMHYQHYHQHCCQANRYGQDCKAFIFLIKWALNGSKSQR